MKGFDVRISIVFLVVVSVMLGIYGLAIKDLDRAHAAITLMIVAAALAMGYIGRRNEILRSE